MYYKRTAFVLMLLMVMFRPSWVKAQAYYDWTAKSKLPCINKTLSIQVHVVLDSLGDPGISLTNIENALDSVNLFFEPICLSFKACAYDTIENYQYDSLWVLANGRIDNEDELFAKHYADSIINLYFVKSIYMEEYDPPDPSGYAPIASAAKDKDFIVYKKAVDPKGLIHEFGHFFGLYHTFEADDFGIELVNRDTVAANDTLLCLQTGDLLCDTDADPRGEVNGNCEYHGARDPAGWPYLPPTDNFMSYYPNACKCRFTKDQYRRMAQQYYTFKKHLW